MNFVQGQDEGATSSNPDDDTDRFLIGEELPNLEETLETELLFVTTRTDPYEKVKKYFKKTSLVRVHRLLEKTAQPQDYKALMKEDYVQELVCM